MHSQITVGNVTLPKAVLSTVKIFAVYAGDMCKGPAEKGPDVKRPHVKRPHVIRPHVKRPHSIKAPSLF